MAVQVGADVTLGDNYCMANPNSTGATGAISAVGSPVAASNDVTLNASSLPNNAFGFFLTSQTQAFTMNPGGSSGNLCLGGQIGRYVGPGQIQNTGMAGEFSLVLDLTQTPQPTGFVSIQAGETWNFTAWHRDTSGTGATSNFTDGLENTFQRCARCRPPPGWTALQCPRAVALFGPRGGGANVSAHGCR